MSTKHLLGFAAAVVLLIVVGFAVTSRLQRSVDAPRLPAAAAERGSAAALEARPHRPPMGDPAHPSRLDERSAGAPILLGPPPMVIDPPAPPLPKELRPPGPPLRRDGRADEWAASAVRSQSAESRIEAVTKLASGGSLADLPLLNQILTTDPDIKVREAAHHAGQIIRSRSGGRSAD